ncbi:hypothetical protein [Roseospira marina]|uniref:hypothetical protein n=1 Tax=Roseospira marina TaxID=140057 RepID=UPI001478D78D|nr:hypothetical protein [Roseospira marina]MBB4312376.1 hypothetical protein [Roseospira marina]MBB5085608.1 hypothetical protein [Roseospira marina]
MLKTATVAFVATLFASSAALACSGWKSADSSKPITTAQADTGSQTSTPWTGSGARTD